MTAQSPSPPELIRAPPRPSLAVGSRTLRAIVRRDWLILRSYRTPLISDLVFGFLNLVVYYFISRAVHPKLGIDLDGAPSYFAFAACGIALFVVVQAAVVGITRRIREEQLTGTLEMLVAQPISAAEIALGVAGFPLLFAMVRALMYLLLAAVFLGLSLDHTNFLGLLVALLATGLAFVSIGVALSAIVLIVKRAEVLGAAAVTGMALVGGAFFPTQVLSRWLVPFSYIVPTRYAFEGTRGALFGAIGWLGPSLVLIAFSAIALPVALAFFSYAIRRNVREGSLNQY